MMNDGYYYQEYLNWDWTIRFILCHLDDGSGVMELHMEDELGVYYVYDYFSYEPSLWEI